MKRDDLNKDIYSNINISDEMKTALISDVKTGKRNADFRFRYSTAIAAFLVVVVIGFSGAGASAAYISYKNRVQELSSQEKSDYEEELAADTYNTVGESMTRNLTPEENKRYLELEDEYYNNGKFPKDSMTFVEKQSDISDDELAYVEEINKIHIPENELSDEQLLQLIDHMAKYNYTMDQKNEITTESESEETSIKDQSIKLIRELAGEEVDDSWIIDVSGNDVTITESDAPNATMYQLTIPKNEDEKFLFNSCGKKYYGLAKEYTKEEAEGYISEGQTASIDFVKEKFGKEDPDRVEVIDFEQTAGDGNTVAVIRYKLYYRDNYVAVIWGIEAKKVYSVMGKNLLR